MNRWSRYRHFALACCAASFIIPMLMGCTPMNAPPPMLYEQASITPDDLKQILKAQYPAARIYITSTEYAIPTRQGLEDVYTWTAARLYSTGKEKMGGVWDCKAITFTVYTDWLMAHAEARGGKGLAAGVIYYRRPEGGHAVNSYFDGSRVREIEPQDFYGDHSLTAEERQTAWLVLY